MEICSADGQSEKRLDFQGFAGSIRQFSTKLSTEILDRLQTLDKSST
jgi:hypothetical protein